MGKMDKNTKAYDVMLKKHISNKDFVRITRTFNAVEENVYGFILGISKDFLLIQNELDFLLDGFIIIRKDQFDSLRCNRFDKFHKKILKAEGVFYWDYETADSIDLSSWQQLFNNLKKSDYHVTVECEAMDEPNLVIGPVKRVTKDYVGIQYYNPVGQLEAQLTTVKYKDITIVKFGDRYSTTYRKYLKSPIK
jgi:hypothetical protein